MKFAIRILVGIIVSAMTLWGVGTLYYSPVLPLAWRPFGAVIYALPTVLAFLFLMRRGRTAIGALAGGIRSTRQSLPAFGSKLISSNQQMKARRDVPNRL